jgi:hypothetical protein
MDEPPNLEPERMTNDYDIFQGDVMLYSQLISQMSIDPSVDTSDTQYEPARTSSYHIPSPSTQVPKT